MTKMRHVVLGGVIGAMILLNGCDRPHHEPGTPKPTMSEPQQKLNFGAPSEQQQKLTYGGPAETRSPEEYVQQMDEVENADE